MSYKWLDVAFTADNWNLVYERGLRNVQVNIK